MIYHHIISLFRILKYLVPREQMVSTLQICIEPQLGNCKDEWPRGTLGNLDHQIVPENYVFHFKILKYLRGELLNTSA